MFGKKFFIWLVINIFAILVMYSMCASHENVEKKNYFDRLYLNYFEKREYKNRVFCAIPLWALVLFAVLITLAFNTNPYQTYALVAAVAFYFIMFSF